QQPPWSVSSPAAAAMVACAGEVAAAEAGRRAVRIADARSALLTGLRGLPVTPVETPLAPFVLVRCARGTRESLRARGFAVRRGDTFPGLDAAPEEEWVRVAVRGPEVTGPLLDAWRTVAETLR